MNKDIQFGWFGDGEERGCGIGGGCGGWNGEFGLLTHPFPLFSICGMWLNGEGFDFGVDPPAALNKWCCCCCCCCNGDGIGPGLDEDDDDEFGGWIIWGKWWPAPIWLSIAIGFNKCGCAWSICALFVCELAAAGDGNIIDGDGVWLADDDAAAICCCILLFFFKFVSSLSTFFNWLNKSLFFFFISKDCS